MSEFQITEGNISRFSKRLKKSIQNNLQQDISLAQATLLIAEMLGTNGINQMQSILKEEAKQASFNKNFLDKKKLDVVMLPNPDNLEVITLSDGFEKRYLKFAVVEIDFIERRGMPYYINDPYFAIVNLLGVKAKFFNNLDDATAYTHDKKQLILEYAIPAYSHMELSFPICSNYYETTGDGQMIAHTVNNF